MSEIEIIQRLLPRVKEKLFIEPVMVWGTQWAPEKDKKIAGKVQFHTVRNTPLQDFQLINHYLAKFDYAKKYDKRQKKEIDAIWGSLGVSLNFGGQVVQCGIDADS